MAEAGKRLPGVDPARQRAQAEHMAQLQAGVGSPQSVIQDTPIGLDNWADRIEDTGLDFTADDRNDLDGLDQFDEAERSPLQFHEDLSEQLGQISDIDDLPYAGDDPRTDSDDDLDYQEGSQTPIQEDDSEQQADVSDWPDMDFGLSEFSPQISDDATESGFSVTPSEFGEEIEGGFSGETTAIEDEEIEGGFQAEPTEFPPLDLPDISGNQRNELPEYQNPTRPAYDGERDFLTQPETMFPQVYRDASRGL